jgi:sugar phosphate isomerase/epimerase
MWTLSGFADEISPDLDEQCGLFVELGIGWVELRSAWDRNVLDLDDAELDRAGKTLEQYGLRTSSIGSPIGKVGIHDDFDDHLVRFDRALHVAEVLSAPYLRLFSFFLPAGAEPADHRDEVLRRMSALASRAEGRGVVLLHENEKEIYGDSPERCLDLVESVGSPALRLAWDSANFVQCGFRPFSDGYALLRPYVDYVQVKDAILATGEVVPAGEGDGELRETIAALRDDGFDGFFSLEPHLIFGGTLGGFSGADHFRRAHTAFTGLLTEAGISYR